MKDVIFPSDILLLQKRVGGGIIDYDDLMFKSICTDGIFHPIGYNKF